MFEALPAETEVLSKHAVDAAIKVHGALGPGLLESVYEICLAHELRKRGLPVENQIPIPIVLRWDSSGGWIAHRLARSQATNH